ncbi:hypothetical protein BDV06DRAFT_223347 [Aspergillus oleicola]
MALLLRTRARTSALPAKSVAQLILTAAVGFFETKRIASSGIKLSALDIFRHSICLMRGDEKRLFQRFQDSLKKEARQRNPAEQAIDTEFHNKLEETKM